MQNFVHSMGSCMIRWIRTLAILWLISHSVAAQTTDSVDPFQVIRAHFITVTTHLGDGRIEEKQGVRFAVRSAWAHTDAEMSAFADLLIDNPSRFTQEAAIVKLMTRGDLLTVTVDFYRNSQQDILRKLMFFKDTRRRGWERLQLTKDLK